MAALLGVDVDRNHCHALSIGAALAAVAALSICVLRPGDFFQGFVAGIKL